MIHVRITYVSSIPLKTDWLLRSFVVDHLKLEYREPYCVRRDSSEGIIEAFFTYKGIEQGTVTSHRVEYSNLTKGKGYFRNHEQCEMQVGLLEEDYSYAPSTTRNYVKTLQVISFDLETIPLHIPGYGEPVITEMCLPRLNRICFIGTFTSEHVPQISYNMVFDRTTVDDIGNVVDMDGYIRWTVLPIYMPDPRAGAWVRTSSVSGVNK